MARPPNNRTPLFDAPLVMAAKLLASERGRDLVLTFFSDPQVGSIPAVEIREIDGQPITVVSITRPAHPFHRLDLHLERARCALIALDFTDDVPVENVIVEGTALDLLARRRRWPALRPLFQDLKVIWAALGFVVVSGAQSETPLFHLYGRTRGQRELLPLPFRFGSRAIDWRTGLVTEPHDVVDPGETPRQWEVFVRYVGDRERPAARVRAEREASLIAWLTQEMTSVPYVPQTFVVMQNRANERQDPPSGEMFKRAWHEALDRTRAQFRDTTWGRRGPRGPRTPRGGEP